MTDSRQQKYSFIIGEHETARMLRELDWTANPLGDPDAWPEALRASVCLMVNTRHPMCILWGPQHICLYNDAAAGSMASLADPAALGRPAAAIWPNLWPVLGLEAASVLGGGAATWHEDRLIPVNRNGRLEQRWWTYSLGPIHDGDAVGGVMLICSDVTRQHLVAESLQAERARLLELFKQAPGFIAVGYGHDMIFHLVNDAYLQLVGFRDVIGKPVRAALPELEGQGFYELLDQVYRTGVPFRGVAVPIQLQRDPGGPVEQRYLNFVYQPIRQADGTVIGIFVEGHDVTAQQRTEDALREALRANEAIFAYSQDVICVFDEDGAFIQASARARAVWGYEPEELIGRGYMELVHPRDRERTGRAAASIMAGQSTSAFENCYLRKDGTEVPMLWSAVWVAEQRRMYVSARDLSERIKSEELLRQAQKMETIGQLTGGVAHDFNNLLTVIIGNGELLAEKLADQPRLLELAQMMLQAGGRGAELTSRLLAFARRQALEPKILYPDEVIDGIMGLLRHALGEGVEIVLLQDAAPRTVSIDPGQFESALLNVCINARDAMPQGGRLVIETAGAAFDQHYGDLHAEVAPGEYVMVAVSDSGHGMAPEVLERAIDPFFTTKGADRGTGLGLSMVYGFIRQSGGHMTIHSEPGHGTVVKLYLPVVQGGVQYTAAARPGARQVGGSEKILLAEDDPWVRAHAAGVLEELGYTVLAADSGPAALALALGHAGIDLLFTDVIMAGGMNGPQLAAALHEVLPGLPVLYTSGYTENAIDGHGRVDAGVHLLPKPYGPQRLAEKVRAVLDAARPSDGSNA